MAAVFGGLFWAKAVRTVASFDSPAGTWRATVRVMNPGGSSGYSTHIVVSRGSALLPSALLPSRRAKIFVADDADGVVTLGRSGELPVSLRWEGDNRLLVSYPAHAHVYRQETQLGALHIAYEAK
jgi:hypothetical protein